MNFLNRLYKVSAWMAAHITLLVVGVSALALFVPMSFSWIATSAVTPMLGVVMFGMGLTLKPSDFRTILKDISSLPAISSESLSQIGRASCRERV